jgi:hypothetical protein
MYYQHKKIFWQGDFMEKNVGKADAFIRFQFGVAFLVNIILFEPGIVGLIILLTLGLMLIKSAVTGYCPAYKYLKISTVVDTTKKPGGDAAPAAAHH